MRVRYAIAIAVAAALAAPVSMSLQAQAPAQTPAPTTSTLKKSAPPLRGNGRAGLHSDGEARRQHDRDDLPGQEHVGDQRHRRPANQRVLVRQGGPPLQGTGDRQRLKTPLQPLDVATITLRSPKVAGMTKPQYKFEQNNGSVKPVKQKAIKAGPEYVTNAVMADGRWHMTLSAICRHPSAMTIYLRVSGYVDETYRAGVLWHRDQVVGLGQNLRRHRAAARLLLDVLDNQILLFHPHTDDFHCRGPRSAWFPGKFPPPCPL